MILEMPTFPMALIALLRCFKDTFIDILSESYISLLALIVLYTGTFLFAMKGSVGCAAPPSPWDIIHLKGHDTRQKPIAD